MPDDIFQRRKKDTLSKSDRSSKKSIDNNISFLCNKINSLRNYYTTSSCSGRIILMIDQEKKGEGLFLKNYYDLISLNQLKKDLSEIKNNKKYRNKIVKFKQEPCIIHIVCRNLEDAEKMLDNAQLSSWKRTGIIATGRRFVVEMSGTEKLEFPIIDKNKILVSDDFLNLIIEKSNNNLKKSWEKIKKLWKLL